MITDKWHRTNYAMFRLRTLGFNANRLWFQPEVSIDMPCPLCGADIDDEKHFFIDCLAFNELCEKNTFFNLAVAKLQDVPAVLMSNDETVMKMVATFISEALTIRKVVISN